MYGTSWYHSHYSSQYANGLLGPMIIYGPNEEEYDVDIGPLLLSDWYHASEQAVVSQILAPSDHPIEIPSDNTGINGKFNCLLDTGSCVFNENLAKFQFEAGKTHRLRLVNAGALDTLSFSIDSHEMKIIANDFVPVEPYVTDQVTLGIGQRTDILVTANATAGAYWIRVTAICGSSNQPKGLGVIYYDNFANASTTSIIPSDSSPTTKRKRNPPKPPAPKAPKAPKASKAPQTPKGPKTAKAPACDNDPLELTVPKYAMSPPEPDTVIEMDLGIKQNSTEQWNWQINGVNFRGDYNDPILLLSAAGNNSYPWDPQWNVYDLGPDKTFRIVTYNKSPVVHPMHFHGHNFYVLARGRGKWDGNIVRPSNPQRRDVEQVSPGEYIVVQNVNYNPGVWPWHCHIAWHLSAGMNLNFIVQPDQIPNLGVPSIMYQQCRDWAAYTNTTVVLQIDSGF
ncbi:MAG: hypothetical protein Q9227_001535 [Pyrenula ochraceoflavens]